LNTPQPVPEVRFVYKVIHEVWSGTWRVSNTELPEDYDTSDKAHAEIMKLRKQFCNAAKHVRLASWFDGDGIEVFQSSADKEHWIQSWVEKFQITKALVFDPEHPWYRSEVSKGISPWYSARGKQGLSPWFSP